MKKPQSPCLGCDDRVPDPNCHITCEKYIAYSKACEKYRKESYKRKEHNRIMNEIDTRRKMMGGRK